MDLQENTRCATEECDMWKAVMDTGQLNLSVALAPQVFQNIPQPTIQPAHAMEFMTMLASMMNLAMTNSQSVRTQQPENEYVQ